MSARMRSLVLPLLLLLPPVPGFDTIEVAWPAELSGPAALEEYPAIEPFAMTARMYATPPQDSVGADKRMFARRAERGIDVDGRLSTEEWAGADWISDFAQKEPDQGAEPTLRTEFAIQYDDGALYIGARMHADDPDAIAALMTRRDEQGTAERLVVSLDTYGDRRTAYSFAVTAAGVRLDWFHPDDNQENQDPTFNPVWVARTEIVADGWTAEMRIPFSQLRFSNDEQQVWGINVNRFIPNRNEDLYWVVVPRDEPGWSSRFGDLQGIERVPGSSRIELLPYFASDTRLMSDGQLDPDDPFAESSSMSARAGLDFRMGLGPNLTLDATVNPDFGQVEADPAEVNLSAFETFFDERRPFFTEGQQALQGQGPEFYYSRRIGASPHGETDGDFEDVPLATTILGAAKLTGQLPSGLTIGAVAALTDDEQARSFDLATNEMSEVDVEPRTSYGVVRLQQQFGPDQSTFGATFAAVNRSLSEDHVLADEMVSSAYTGGIDFDKRFKDGWYAMQGHAGFSYASGTEAAILDLQERSAHYFQRPDQDHVELDPTRTSLSGWTASFRHQKRTGRFRFGQGTWLDSPGFEINDAGRLGRGDEINAWLWTNYRQTDPGPVFRNWLVGSWTNHRFNFGGVQLRKLLGAWTELTWKNFWETNITVERLFESQSDTKTRGGPLMRNPSVWFVSANLESNPSESTRWRLEAEAGADDLNGWEYALKARFATRPNARLEVSVEPRFSRRLNPRQYIDTFENGPERTFGERFVFGALTRNEIATQLRANYAFSPDLNLELYAEPFASSGRYGTIGELFEPREDTLREYGSEGIGLERAENGDFLVTEGDEAFTIENPDFNVLSFRSNLVLRWEWSPGSTLFVTWQQNRETDNTLGRSVGLGDLGDTLTADGENVLAVKFSYWLPL